MILSVVEAKDVGNWLFSLAAAVIAGIALYKSTHKATWEVNNALFQEWWGKELHQCRKTFFTKFLRVRSTFNGKRMKELDSEWDEVRQLCWFFDRVGWMSAAKLIKTDLVLGPMQHTMRKVWMVMEPLILNDRRRHGGHRLDAVHLRGFEFLFDESERRHHAKLLKEQYGFDTCLDDIYADELDFLSDQLRNGVELNRRWLDAEVLRGKYACTLPAILEEHCSRHAAAIASGRHQPRP